MFQLLFERSADAILLFDPEANLFVDCNDAAVKLLRANSKEQLLGASPEELSPRFQPDGTLTRDKSAQVIALVKERGGYRFEWLSRCFDGTELPLEVLSTPIDLDGRNLTVVVSRDISERKRTEAALRDSEQKFRGLFEASSDAIQILDPIARRVVDCNAATVKMAGGTDKAWFLSQPVDRFEPPLQPDGRPSREVARAWAMRAMSEGPQCFEWMAMRHSGEEFPVEVLLTPLQFGGRQMLVSVARDITERKKTERQLLELNQSLERRVAERTAALTTSEAQFRAMVEHAPEAILVLNGETGRILFGNQHACALYGVPMEKLPELTPAQLSPEFQPNGRRSSELAREIMNQTLAGASPVFEWMHQQPDGRLVPTEVRLLRLPAEGRNLIRASIIDNTKRKQAEAEMQKALTREMELSQLKSNFVSMVSHEFRTPLGIIQSSAELLRDFYQNMKVGEREEQLESITRNTRRMAEMMEEILILSRLDAGKLDFQPAVLDLNAFCRRLVDEILSATQRRCAIELSLKSLPARASADERLLGHIFTNLLSNAVKYSEPGSTVKFAIQRQGPEAVCVVRDCGIGISEQDQAHLFKAFHRGTNVGNRPGTGLGLLMVKRCVNLHQGSLELVSRLKKGTTVTVRLPAFANMKFEN